MLRRIDPIEVARDLVNWLDATAPNWQTRPGEEQLRLLGEARDYYTGVSRRYRIVDSEFMPALDAAVQRVRQEHGF